MNFNKKIQEFTVYIFPDILSGNKYMENKALSESGKKVTEKRHFKYF